MPKHKKAKRSSSSRHSRDSRASRKHSSRERSRERSRRERRRRERSRDFHSSDSSRDSSTGRSRSRGKLEFLRDFQDFLARRDRPGNLDTSQVRSPAETLSPQDESSPASPATNEPYAAEQNNTEHTVAQADRGIVPATPATSSVNEASPMPGNITFAGPLTAVIPESQDLEVVPAECTLAEELFGTTQTSPASSSWNPTVLQAIQTELRGGLNVEMRTSLLSKYELKGELTALAPPKLNKELAAALTPSVIKRDEYQSSSQTQVGACLNALGSGMSLLLKPEILQDLKDEVRSALTYLSDGIHLLADHQYRLSLTRRAFTKPSLNILGKNAAESAPIDDFLFGQNFAETLKAAQICEKTGREVSKAAPPIGKKTLQPVRQAAQHRAQFQTPKTSGNRRAPARPSSARRTGASYHQSQRHRSRSQTRSRRH